MYKSKIAVRGSHALPRVLGKDKNIRPVDTFDSCGYELNRFGHIRNDFAVLNDTQSLLDYQRAVSRMQELQAAQPDNTNKSFEDIVREVRPRWCQTPAELDRFEQYLINNELEFYNQLREKESEAGSTLDLDDGNVDPVATKVS